MGKKESIADTARVLGRMYDGIEYRGFQQELHHHTRNPAWAQHKNRKIPVIIKKRSP